MVGYGEDTRKLEHFLKSDFVCEKGVEIITPASQCKVEKTQTQYLDHKLMCEKTKKMKGVNLMLHFLWHGYIIFPALKMDSSSKMKQN